MLGQPICGDCYDYTGAVLFNAMAPELWRRFTITLRRRLAALAGVTQRAFNARVRVSYAKVAEYQRRGVVHFHAVIRLDAADDQHSPPPAWASPELLAAAVREAAALVSVTVDLDGTPRVLRWGEQLDVRPITGHAFDGNEPISEEAVAGYIAKYATKAAETTGTVDRRITDPTALAELDVPDHARRMIATCLALGERDDLADLRLTEWAHMLGFRGHFSTKSRRYSTILSALRDARARHRAEAAGLLFDDETTLVIAHWAYVGKGHTPGEALLAAQATTYLGPTSTDLTSPQKGGTPCPDFS